jgi:DNA-dependent RNA polymerase auxiliary subunit epsilon
MKLTKNSRSVNVETLKALQEIAQYVSENEWYQLEWLGTVKDEGWEYGKKSLYYLAKKSLSNLSGRDFEKEMAVEFCQTVGGSQR